MKIKPSSQRPHTAKLRRKVDRPDRITVGQYLLKKLDKLGLRHIFGTQETELIRFTKLIDYHSTISFLESTTPLSAGGMADGYARAKSLGCIATIFDHIGQNLETLVRAAYESVPLIVIFGTSQEHIFHSTPFLSSRTHSILEDTMSICEKIYRQLVKCWVVLDNPKTAAKKIDFAIDSCLYFQTPVCIELPNEIVEEFIPNHISRPTHFSSSDPEILQESLQHIQSVLNNAQKPFIALGRELICHRCIDPIISFAEVYNIPLMTTYLGKSAINEDHPLWHGMYLPHKSDEHIQDLIIESDCGIFLGVNESAKTGFGYLEKDLPQHSIIASSSQLVIDNTSYPHVLLHDFSRSLAALPLANRYPISPNKQRKTAPYVESKELSISSVIEILQEQANDDSLLWVVECNEKETFSQHLHLEQFSFISSTYPTTGWGVEAALGAQVASPLKRVIAVLTLDRFQASMAELALAAQHHIKPIFIVLREDHENASADYDPCNSFSSCVLTELPQLFHEGKALQARTKKAFKNALISALGHQESFFLIDTITS